MGAGVAMADHDSVSLDRQRRALDRAQAFFRNAMDRSGGGQTFVTERGVTAAAVDDYALGFAPHDWQALLRAIDDTPAALATGLASKAASGHIYARFRNRLIFPIHDADGGLVGFGGRTVADSEPKYLNSSGSALFSKGVLLYGLAQAESVSRDEEIPFIGVAEGFLDVIGTGQSGVPMVGSMGTAVTAEQLKLLYSRTDDIVLCLDGDEAGQRAARAAIETAAPFLTINRGLRICALEPGHDPDSYITAYGRDALFEVMQEAPTVSDYLAEQLMQETEGRATFAYDALLPIVRSVPDPYVQSELLDTLARRLNEPVPTDVRSDEAINYLGDPLYMQGRDRSPRGVTMSCADARVLIARSLFSCPDVAKLVDIPVLDRGFGDIGLAVISFTSERLAADEDLTGVDLLQEWALNADTQAFVDYAMRGRVLSPALAREGIQTAAHVLLDQTEPCFDRRGRSAPTF